MPEGHKLVLADTLPVGVGTAVAEVDSPAEAVGNTDCSQGVVGCTPLQLTGEGDKDSYRTVTTGSFSEAS